MTIIGTRLVDFCRARDTTEFILKIDLELAISCHVPGGKPLSFFFVGVNSIHS